MLNMTPWPLDVREQEKAHIYKCHFGLFEAVAPLYSFGTLTGYLMMGQTLRPDRTWIKHHMKKPFPWYSIRLALKRPLRIPVRGQRTIDSLVTIMEVCAQYITLSNHMNLSKNELSARSTVIHSETL